MSRIFGFVVGLVWVGFAAFAFVRSSEGWGAGHTDIGFWWAVIAMLLGLAAASAVVGTLMHTRR